MMYAARIFITTGPSDSEEWSYVQWVSTADNKNDDTDNTADKWTTNHSFAN